MSIINNFTQEQFIKLHARISEQNQKSNTLEQAAQEYMNLLYDCFTESIVLCRFFLTIKFNDLPEANREFVTTLAKSNNVFDLVSNDSLILTLLGTRGENSQWNNRKNSQGHVGIPLISSQFIDKIPMMSRLLKELGVGIDWIDNKKTDVAIKNIGSMGGVFYVNDAKTAVDTQERLIITAQDFVDTFSVKSVFGIGGEYLGHPIFFTTIIFLRDHISRELANRFMLQSNKFKSSTIKLVEDNKILAS
jgi:hypothetical protein